MECGVNWVNADTFLYELFMDLGGVWEDNQNLEGDPFKEVGSKLGESGVMNLLFIGILWLVEWS